MISKKDKKNLIIIAGIFIGLLVLYIAQGVYNSNVGKVVTEYALNYTQVESVNVEGFAVRDENRTSDGKNISFLHKQENKYYVPLVDDSANVSRNDTIALCFSQESGAEAYLDRLTLSEKIKALEELKSQGELSYVNVVGLNSLIYSSAINYAECLQNTSLSDLQSTSEDFVQKMTTKQIAVGEKMDFDSQIKAYKAEYDALKSSLGNYENVKAPYAGYFVSGADGYESAISYDDVADKKVKCKDGEKLLKSEPTDANGVYGKIVAQFTWYFIFDMAENESSALNEGSTVYVNFPNKGIENIKMTVHDISEQKDSVITVTLRCKLMNEDLVKLRKEKAEIILNKHEGLKINRDAIVQNEEGIDGVHVLTGNFVQFSPIDIKYYGEDYVIAGKYYVYKKDENNKNKLIVDEEATSRYRAIRLYDNIIVKGKNIEDGKVIG